MENGSDNLHRLNYLRVGNHEVAVTHCLCLLGAHWKNLDSLILSHTEAESTIFVDGHIQTDEQFTKFVKDLFPSIARDNLVQNLTDFYPPVKSGMLKSRNLFNQSKSL